MAHEDDVGSGRFVRRQPSAEVVPGDVDGAIRLVPGIDLGVDDVGLDQHVG